MVLVCIGGHSLANVVMQGTVAVDREDVRASAQAANGVDELHWLPKYQTNTEEATGNRKPVFTDK